MQSEFPILLRFRNPFAYLLAYLLAVIMVVVVTYGVEGVTVYSHHEWKP